MIPVRRPGQRLLLAGDRHVPLRSTGVGRTGPADVDAHLFAGLSLQRGDLEGAIASVKQAASCAL